MIFNVAFIEQVLFISIRVRIMLLVVHFPLVLKKTQTSFSTNALLFFGL